jgi:hypothetical protein
MAGHLSRFQCAIARSSRWMARRSGTWQLQCQRRNTFHT